MAKKEYSESHRHNESKKEGLDPIMKKFVGDLSRALEEKNLLDQLYITDGKRSPNASYGSSKSRHHHGEAIDIRPSAQIYDFLVNTREGNKLMMDYGVGIYDETDPKNMKYATGKHFHIGTDSAFKKQTEERWRYFSNNPDATVHEDTRQAYIAKDPNFNYDKFLEERDKKGLKGSNDFTSWAESEVNSYENYMKPYQDSPLEYKVYSGVGHTALTPKQEIEKSQEIEEVKKGKVETNPHLQKIKEEQKKREAFMQSMSALSYDVKKNKTSSSNYSIPASRIPIPENQMVDLPSIWQFPEYQDGGEISFSEMGYKEDSPDKDRPFNIINTNKITMKGVKHKVLGIDNKGNRKIMEPEKDYTFEGDMVLEIPLKMKRTKGYR